MECGVDFYGVGKVQFSGVGTDTKKDFELAEILMV